MTAWSPNSPRSAPDTRCALDPTVLADPALRFFVQLHLGTGRSDHYHAGDRNCASVVANDGSWAELIADGDGPHPVRYDGTHNPWQTVEHAHRTWNHLGRPEPTDLGLTVTPTTQYIWHHQPDSAWTHSLIAT